MATIFSELTALTEKVRDLKQQIKTEEFLEVCRHIVPVTGVHGSKSTLCVYAH